MHMKKITHSLSHQLIIIISFATALGLNACTSSSQEAERSSLSEAKAENLEPTGSTGKPRVVVLTDIGGDPDDEESMVRFLLYSNEFDVEGLIATGRVIRDNRPALLPELIAERINAYGEVRDQLLHHADGYPTVPFLLDKIKTGYPVPKRNWDPKTQKTSEIPLTEKIGADKNSEGSDWIIEVVDRPDPLPVWIAVWGTASDLAQALWQVKQERSAEELATFVAKLRVYAIAKQDLSNDWILENFPNLFIIQSSEGTGTFRGIYQQGDTSYYSEAWVEENVLDKHGPLGKLYTERPSAWSAPYIEGDTPSFLYLIANGLNYPEQPTWGSWGGRYQGAKPLFVDLNNDPLSDKPIGEKAQLSVARWRPAFQNDFEARMDWCVKPFEEANHNPVAAFDGDTSKDVVTLTVSPGAEISLDAEGSTDPDGDQLDFHWLVYEGVGTYTGSVNITNANTQVAIITIPQNAATGQNFHVILEVKDDGEPMLYSYRRIIIVVE